MIETNFTLSTGEVTKFVFSPLQLFQINKDAKIVYFNALSKLFEDNTALLTTQHINIMIKQQNYANIRKEKVANTNIQAPPKIGDFKLKDFSDLESLLEKRFKGCSLKPLGTDDFSRGESNYKKEFSDEINKISEKYARKPIHRMYYYPRPTPQDVLLEEHEHIITNSYNGKEIYEWNIDGYTYRQIYTTVHRLLMYNTICKANKNRRWSDNSETIRTMLQNHRCKTLTSFRFYKDVFLSRVMELPECNSSHWKSKFIDGLAALFAKRVRKTLRGHSDSIYYGNYTYGKLRSACIQEGLSLCNEMKLNQQDCKAWKKRRIEKKERRAEPYREKKRFYKSRQTFSKIDTCHKCGRFGHYARDCRVKEKIKNLDIDDNINKQFHIKKKDDNIKESLCKIMLNYDSGKSETKYSSHEESSTSEDLKALHQEDYM
ncbi:hypothetical protein H5410_046681 [Solanum commersonii]|uniref:CCHC-type domain-containing protein n=1 Tax=Solanum commersonii TaxID=4109 RepID=A0A9J5XF40_SOLCO|nr:hypothetical protein H5410_046681 [Solanum commersonii]